MKTHDCDVHRELVKNGLVSNLYGFEDKPKLRYNEYKDNQWYLMSTEGMIELEDVRFCPYCGEELEKK